MDVNETDRMMSSSSSSSNDDSFVINSSLISQNDEDDDNAVTRSRLVNNESSSSSSSQNYGNSDTIAYPYRANCCGKYWFVPSWIYSRLDYTSVKLVVVRDPKVALFHYLILLIIFSWVVVYNIVYKKKYQRTDTFIGSSNIKVKGVALSKDYGNEIYDAGDLVVPALENDGIFVTTRIVKTRNQKRGTCPGHDEFGYVPAQISELCPESGYCEPNKETLNGFTTGKCIGKWCEISGWCPVESISENIEQSENDSREEESSNDNNDEISELIEFNNLENFTLFMRFDGWFPNLHPKVRFSNFDPPEEKYNEIPDFADIRQKKRIGLVWNLNLWYLSDIVAKAIDGDKINLIVAPLSEFKEPPNRPSTKQFESIIRLGAVILINVLFDCNLDLGDDLCTPHFEIVRLDEGKGFNYRAVEYHRIKNEENQDDIEYRDLVKRFGVRFHIVIGGTGGKFDIAILGISIGAGLGLLGLASVFTDIVLKYSRSYMSFKKAKYEEIEAGQ